MDHWKVATIRALRALLPAGVRDSLLHLSFHLANREFRRFAYEYAHAPAMDFGLAAMAQRGFAPATVIDVGAYQGEWSRLAREIWPKCALVLVEPNADAQPGLLDFAASAGAVLHRDLLGADDDREVFFNVMASGSSVLAERSAVPRITQTRRLRRLDSVLTDVAGPALLKIDAQGYELEILRGAERVLPAVEAVLLEIAVIEINEGAPLLHEVLVFMKRLGFVTYDLLELHRRPLDRALNQVDIVFVRETSPLIADKRHFA